MFDSHTGSSGKFSRKWSCYKELELNTPVNSIENIGNKERRCREGHGKARHEEVAFELRTVSWPDWSG